MVDLRKMYDERDNYLVVQGFSADPRDIPAHLVVIVDPVGFDLQPDGDFAVHRVLGDELIDILPVKLDGPRLLAGMLHSRAKALEFSGILGKHAHGIGQEIEAILAQKHPDIACSTRHCVCARFFMVGAIMGQNR